MSTSFFKTGFKTRIHKKFFFGANNNTFYNIYVRETGRYTKFFCENLCLY